MEYLWVYSAFCHAVSLLRSNWRRDATSTSRLGNDAGIALKYWISIAYCNSEEESISCRMSLHICRCSVSNSGTKKSSLLGVLEPGRIYLSNQACPTIIRQGNPENVLGCCELDSWLTIWFCQWLERWDRGRIWELEVSNIPMKWQEWERAIKKSGGQQTRDVLWITDLQESIYTDGHYKSAHPCLYWIMRSDLGITDFSEMDSCRSPCGVRVKL